MEASGDIEACLLFSVALSTDTSLLTGWNQRCYHLDQFRREDSAELRSLMYSNGETGNSRTRVNIRESERRRTV